MLGRPASLLTISAAVLLLTAIGIAHAEVSLSGYWEPMYFEDYTERLQGPEIGDYAGLPISDAARLRADSWDASLLTLPEHQCKPHSSTYGFRGVGTLRVWETREPETQRLSKIDTWISWQSQHREIWFDGHSPPPPLALHTWQGFSAGHWNNDVLVVDTSGLKAGSIRRNGLPLTDNASMREFFFRHGDILTHVTIVSDPVYLTEPLVRSNGFRYSMTGTTIPYPCRPAIEIVRPKGIVPHHLPGQNTALTEQSTAHGVPLEAARGGARTALPEYAAYMQTPRSHLPPMPATEKSERRIPRIRQQSVSEVAILHVQAGVFLISVAEHNVVAQVGSQGVLIVDTGDAAHKDQLKGAITKLADGRKVRYIINSSGDQHLLGGNESMRLAGETILGGNVVMDDPRGQQGATVVAHESVQMRMVNSLQTSQPVPEGLWPTETFVQDAYDLFFNDEAVLLSHPPAAHTNGDVFVFFRKSDVIATGDIFVTTRFPTIDIEHGGSVNGLIAALNQIIDIAVPKDKQEGGTLIVPGHGRLCDEADVVEYRDMITIIRDRIQDMISRGMSLEQVRAAQPTADYDGRFGSNRDEFIVGVFHSLKNSAGSQSSP